MKWFHERKGFQRGKEMQRKEMKGLKDRKKLFMRRKKEFKHGTRISKNPHYCGCWNWLHLQPPPPLPITQTEERLNDKGDPARTKGMNEIITGIPNKIQNNPYYGARTSVYLFIFF
jgi:hypothetical protein